MDINGFKVPARLDQKRLIVSNLAMSKDHLTPNPFTRKSRYRKRTHPEQGIDNIRLAHRYCNAMRGQLEITDTLKSSIRASLEQRYSATMGQFTQFDIDFRNWRESFDTTLKIAQRTKNDEISQFEIS